MRDVLEAVARGELSPESAEATLSGYVTSEAGRFDAARERRRGIPEAIYAAGKRPDEVATLATTAVETTGRALVTRVPEETATVVIDRIVDDHPDATVERRGRTLIAQTGDYTPPTVDASVGLLTAGTADGPVADEAQAVIESAGIDVTRIDDVGVAALSRLLDQLHTVRRQDVLIVAAGREGALPTVVAGLVDAPVIGLPVASGYGRGGDGSAALDGMLQSCTVLSVVNVDAGYVAGSQATLIARAIAHARTNNGPGDNRP